MAAQALYLKYRPRTFDEVVGQEAITRTLRNALRQGRIRHAYLLAGPRGTGKTTTARLLAKAVNCLAPEDERPCNQCAICQAVNGGRLLDLIEIDAASNRGIDEIRDIREKVGFRPNQARYKVYVLDEAHMLTEPAFNALLKTLEEPPPHVIFALVTTDPHKIPATITSRCQRFDFRRISVQGAVDRLGYIAAQEGLHVEPAALELIARQATGAMRDAISLLDQLASYGDEITLDQVQMVLGTVAGEAPAQLAAALSGGGIADGLSVINRVIGDGVDPRQLAREMVDYLRGVLLIKQGAGGRLLNATAEQAAAMERLAAQITTERLVEAIRLFNGAAVDLRSGLQTIPQLPLELALVQGALGSAPAAGPAAPSAAGSAAPSAAGSAAPSAAGPAAPTAATPAAPTAAGSAAPTAGTAAAPSAPTARQAGQAPGGGREGERQAADPGRHAQGPGSQGARAVREAPPTEEQDRQPTGTADSVRSLRSLRSEEQRGGPSVSLAQVRDRWGEIIAAVQARNRTTAAVLRSGCQPIDVADGVVIVTAPSAILRDKLEDPQRKLEIQDALGGVLGARCRVKLVLPGEHTPRPQPPGPGLDDEDIGQIERWAAERGGHTTVIT